MPHLRPAALVALLACTGAAASAHADGRVLLMVERVEREELAGALRNELTPRGLDVTAADPPPGETLLERAAAAQRAAATGGAAAALWVERDRTGDALRIVAPTGELPQAAPLPRPVAELSPRVFAVIASELVAELGPPSPAEPGGQAGEPEAPEARAADLSPPPPPPSYEAAGPPPAAGSPPPQQAPAPQRTLPPGTEPAPAPHRGSPPPQGQGPHPGDAPSPRYGAPAYDPYEARRIEREQQRAERARIRAERRERRGPRMPRDEWHWRIGAVATFTPRVATGGWDPYETQTGYALRVTVGHLVFTRLRLDFVGAIGSVPDYGPFGNLGGQVQFTTAAWAFRFAAGMSVTAMIAADRFEDDDFGWVGVEVFIPLEIGWELSERFGIDFAAGPSFTKPGEDDVWPGGMFVLEVELAH